MFTTWVVGFWVIFIFSWLFVESFSATHGIPKCLFPLGIQQISVNIYTDDIHMRKMHHKNEFSSEERVQWLSKTLSYKREDLSANPQNSCKKPGMWPALIIPQLRRQRQRSPRDHWPASLAYSTTSGSGQWDTWCQISRDGILDTTPEINLWLPHTSAHMCTCTTPMNTFAHMHTHHSSRSSFAKLVFIDIIPF